MYKITINYLGNRIDFAKTNDKVTPNFHRYLDEITLDFYIY